MDDNGEKKVSLKRIEANRKNALRSTGPKTQAGKRAVQWNALKHGLLAKEVVIRAGDGQESATEFRRLLTQLCQELEPQGILEEMLVETIAVCYWRLRRMLRYETGEIRRKLDTASSDYLSVLSRRAREAKDLGPDGFHGRLRKNSYGLSILLKVLNEVCEEVETLGYLSEPAYEELEVHFGAHENSLANRCWAVSQVDTDEAAGGESAAPARNSGRQKKRILGILDRKRKRLEERIAEAEKRESLQLESKLASLSLPSRDAVDKILRYEAAIERQIYRAMDQLERLQRRRLGEVVPPPLSVKLSQN